MLSTSLSRKLLSSRNVVFNLSQSVPFSTELPIFKTDVDPIQHSSQQTGRFYQIPESDKHQLFLHGGIPKSYDIQCITFTETRVMVREPAVKIINIIKNTDFTKTPPMRRFVLYGKLGSGKSLSLAHVIHYANKAGYLLVHVPWVGSWMRRCKEYSNSLTRAGFVDLNLDAANFLIHFKNQNVHLLKDFKVGKEYVWSKRETTPAGSPLTDLIDHGVNRVKYASDCVVALCDEIKRLTDEGKCKTVVAIDGVNALFHPKTRVFTEKKEMIPPSRITLAQGFLELLKPDWKNSFVVATVDSLANGDIEDISYMPLHLLGRNGFNYLDPFIPIRVDAYSEKEFLSCMTYYKDRKWIQPIQGLDEELKSLSAMNPYKLMQLCNGL